MDAAKLKAAGIMAGTERKKHEKKRGEIKARNAETGAALKKFWSGAAKSSAVMARNGAVGIAWAVPMLAVMWAALQLEFIVAALVLGETGGILMETPADVITTYVVLAITCGFDLFFSFKIENALLRAASRRFWHLDKRTGEIDKGELYNLKHSAESVE